MHWRRQWQPTPVFLPGESQGRGSLLGWQLRGNILGLNFQLYDADGGIIAVIGQKLLSLHDKYCVDIYRPEAEPVVVAILVTLQHMIKDREARASSSSSSSSSGN